MRLLLTAGISAVFMAAVIVFGYSFTVSPQHGSVPNGNVAMSSSSTGPAGRYVLQFGPRGPEDLYVMDSVDGNLWRYRSTQEAMKGTSMFDRWELLKDTPRELELLGKSPK